jgi:hypothetical protein
LQEKLASRKKEAAKNKGELDEDGLPPLTSEPDEESMDDVDVGDLDSALEVEDDEGGEFEDDEEPSYDEEEGYDDYDSGSYREPFDDF